MFGDLALADVGVLGDWKKGCGWCGTQREWEGLGVEGFLDLLTKFNTMKSKRVFHC